MPLTISNDATIEKNKLHSASTWIALLDIDYPGEDIIRIANNNANVDWNSNTYLACPFKVSGNTQDNEGSIPEISLVLYDFSRLLIPIIDDYSGGLGAIITFYLVLSDHLDNNTPEYTLDFEITNTSINSKYEVNFKLGSSNPLKYKIPQDKYIKDFCRYKDFKGTFCKYAGGEDDCDRTLARCRELLNSTNFGGCPGVGSEAYIA